MGGQMTAGLTQLIIGAAMRVHSALGPGLLESVYETCLAWELRNEGLAIEVQKALPLRYRGIDLASGFRLDLAVERSVLVELKSVQRLEPIHAAQTLTYLKLSGYQSALLLNFNSTHLRDGIRRFAPRPNAPEHNLPSSPPPGPFRSSAAPQHS